MNEVRSKYSFVWSRTRHRETKEICVSKTLDGRNSTFCAYGKCTERGADACMYQEGEEGTYVHTRESVNAR